MSRGSTLTQRDVEEAARVSARGDGHQFEIQLGHLCNNRCVFCSSGQLTQLRLARHIPLDPVVQALEQARAAGARRVTFLGGEPTLHKGFRDALRRAVELGFEEIVIFTNGVMFPHPGFIESVVALGRFEWRVSIQGGNEAAHVAVTGRQQSFRRILHGLRELRARGQRVTANLCVNRQSYRSLPDYPALVEEYGLAQLHVDIVRPASTGERSREYLGEIMAPYSEMAPYFAEMLEAFERRLPGFDVNVGNLPFCILPGWASHIHHGGEETVTVACDPSGLEPEVDKYEWHASQRRHLPGCERCVFRPDCTGVFSEYLAIHGGAEFVPVTPEELVARDPEGRAFVFLAGARLAGLLALVRRAELPRGFSSASVHRDFARRSLSVSLEGPTGAARVTAVPARFPSAPGAPGVPLLETGELRCVVAASESLSREEVAVLLRWLEGALASLGGSLDVSGVLADHHERRLRAHGRRRARQLAGRLRQARLPGTLGSAVVQDEEEGALASLRGVAGEGVDVRFGYEVREGRVQVTVGVSLLPGTDLALGRGVAEMVTALVGQRREPAERAAPPRGAI